MRTAEEAGRAIAQIQACNEATGANLQRLILGVLRDYKDDAIAHGMTLSAEIAWKEDAGVYCAHDVGQRYARKAILTARDNKIWRKE